MNLIYAGQDGLVRRKICVVLVSWTNLLTIVVLTMLPLTSEKKCADSSTANT